MKRPSSILFVPAANERAMKKAPDLAARALILDLEDALSPDEKQAGRAGAIRFLRESRPASMPVAVRINTDSLAAMQTDLRAILPERPDAIVLPKLESAGLVQTVQEMAQSMLPGHRLPIWAMVETPKGILNLQELAQAGTGFELAALIAGTNDLAKALRVPLTASRTGLDLALQSIVLHARAFGLLAFDGVYNDFNDADGFAAQCAQGKSLGFDGKTLIHPNQIAAANAAFGPGAAEIKWAKAVVRAFSLKKNAGKGAVQVQGKMAELLHLEQAKDLLAGVEDAGVKRAPKQTARKKAPAPKTKG